MALNVGENFKQRWLNTPEAVRHTFCDELMHISTLLDPQTPFNTWQQQETLLQHQHRKQIKQAYEELKQQILAEQKRLAEEKKRQRQAELEAKIAADRLEEQKRLEQLKQDEIERQHYELEQLQQISAELKNELHQLSASEIVRFDTQLNKQFNQTRLDLDDIQVRLELESDTIIDNLLSSLRIQLKQAAKEEIDLLILSYKDKLQSF